MALQLKGRINTEHGQACSYSTLITAEWKDKSEKGEGGETERDRRRERQRVEGQLKCKTERWCEFDSRGVYVQTARLPRKSAGTNGQYLEQEVEMSKTFSQHIV